MTHVVRAGIVVVLLATEFAAAAETTPGVPWRKDFKAALREARTTGKPVMVDFWAKWCEWCHKARRHDLPGREGRRAPARVRSGQSGYGGIARRARALRAARRGDATDDRFPVPPAAACSSATRLRRARDLSRAPEGARRLASEVSGWESALARDRDDAAALSALGVLLSEEKLFAESRDLLRRAARGGPEPARRRAQAYAPRAGSSGDGSRPARRSRPPPHEAIAITPADPGEDAAAEQALGALPSR